MRPLTTPPPRLRRRGKEDREPTSLADVTLDFDPAPVLGDDTVRHCEPEPRALSDGLGREEGLEDAGEMLRGARPLVLDAHAQVIALRCHSGRGRTGGGVPTSHPQSPAPWHRLDAVHEHVRQHLLDLARVDPGEHGRSGEHSMVTWPAGGWRNQVSVWVITCSQVGEPDLRSPPA